MRMLSAEDARTARHFGRRDRRTASREMFKELEGENLHLSLLSWLPLVLAVSVLFSRQQG